MFHSVFSLELPIITHSFQYLFGETFFHSVLVHLDLVLPQVKYLLLSRDPWRSSSRIAVAVFVCTLHVLGSRPVFSGEVLDIQNVELGIDGQFQVGRQTGLHFDLSHAGDSLRRVVPQILTVDPDGHGVISTLPEVEVGPGTVRINALFRSGKLDAPVMIEILEAGQVVTRKTLQVNLSGTYRCLQQDSHFWILAGAQPAYEAAAAELRKIDPGSIHLTSFEKVARGLTDARMLDCVNLIVLNGETRIAPELSEILEEWVQHGGRLVIAVGEHVEELRSGSLKSWLPVLPVEKTDVRNLSPLNQMVPGSSPLRMLLSVPGGSFDATSGTVLASGLGAPLAIRGAYGSGVVTLLSVRMDRKPLSIWDSRAEFAMILADYSSNWAEFDQARKQGRVDAELNPTGVTDLQTQLLHALDDYADVPRPSYWIVIGWCAGLVLLIGPVDYFLVHDLLKRPQLTWITLPVWLTLMTCWSYPTVLATNAMERRGRKIEILNLDLTTNQVHGKAWVNFYSEETRRNKVNVAVSAPFLLPETSNATSPENVKFLETSWIDRPETSYRGMYRSGGLETQKPMYHLANDQRSVPDLPTRIYSTGALGTAWQGKLDPEQVAHFDLRDPGTGRLEGTVTYLGDQVLTEWFIAYGNFAYFPRTARGESQIGLRRGDTFQLDSARSNRLRGVLIGLTQTSIFNDRQEHQASDVSYQKYDPLARDPYPILRTLSFHAVTGGQTYSNLDNHSLETSDLSPLLGLQRAVLFGRVPTPYTEFQVNDQALEYEQQDGVIRIVLPVKYEQIDVDAPPDPTLLQMK